MPSGSDETEKARARLRSRLMPPTDPKTLAKVISQFLDGLPKSSPSKESLARELANYLSNHAIFSPQRQFIERLICNHPVELNEVLNKNRFTEMQAFGAWLQESGWKAKRRAGAHSPKERALWLRHAKERYERERNAARASSYDRIEMHFNGSFDDSLCSGEHLSNPLAEALLGSQSLWTSAVPKNKPLLDSIFSGGEVRMSSGSPSLESLFGIGRKLLPCDLPSRKKGRMVFYDYRALLKCMGALLETNRWLPDAKLRHIVLLGIIRRAREVARADILAAVEETLGPHIA